MHGCEEGGVGERGRHRSLYSPDAGFVHFVPQSPLRTHRLAGVQGRGARDTAVGEEEMNSLGARGTRRGDDTQRIQPRRLQPRLLGQFAPGGVHRLLAFVDQAPRQVRDLRVVEIVVLRDHRHPPAMYGKDAHRVRRRDVRVRDGFTVGAYRFVDRQPDTSLWSAREEHPAAAPLPAVVASHADDPTVHQPQRRTRAPFHQDDDADMAPGLRVTDGSQGKPTW